MSKKRISNLLMLRIWLEDNNDLSAEKRLEVVTQSLEVLDKVRVINEQAAGELHGTLEGIYFDRSLSDDRENEAKQSLDYYENAREEAWNATEGLLFDTQDK